MQPGEGRTRRPPQCAGGSVLHGDIRGALLESADSRLAYGRECSGSALAEYHPDQWLVRASDDGCDGAKDGPQRRTDMRYLIQVQVLGAPTTVM